MDSTELMEAPPMPAPHTETHAGHTGLWILGIGALIVIVLAGAYVASMLARLRHEKELAEAAAREADSPPRVSVATARRVPSPTADLTLPGSALPYRDASLYARTTGYVREWTPDIGDHVTKGQVLAVISAPDVDDQLVQSQANLALAKANVLVSKANLELAKITLDRDLKAGPGTATSLQQIDQDKAQVTTTDAQVKSAEASIDVNEATVQQYKDLQSFQKIIAPFSGVITSRSVDPGVLVTADNPSETRPIFYLMETDKLRVFVNVPQVYATAIKQGQDAVVYREEDPGQKFAGRVLRTANALDPNTRTLLTQVDVPNPNDALRPGTYLQVNFVVTRAAPAVLIPSAALITLNDGIEVAILDKNQTVRYRKVQLGRDDGTDVEIVSGLNGDETVIVHPGDALAEGRKVEPVATKGGGEAEIGGRRSEVKM